MVLGREAKFAMVAKSKQQITVALFASAAGTKEKAVVIWNAETPGCMKQFNKSALPVGYRSPKRSWMTTENCPLQAETGATSSTVLYKLKQEQQAPLSSTS